MNHHDNIANAARSFPTSSCTNCNFLTDGRSVGQLLLQLRIDKHTLNRIARSPLDACQTVSLHLFTKKLSVGPVETLFKSLEDAGRHSNPPRPKPFSERVSRAKTKFPKFGLGSRQCILKLAAEWPRVPTHRALLELPVTPEKTLRACY